jgi:hypothetical protein
MAGTAMYAGSTPQEDTPNQREKSCCTREPSRFALKPCRPLIAFWRVLNGSRPSLENGSGQTGRLSITHIHSAVSLCRRPQDEAAMEERSLSLQQPFVRSRHLIDACGCTSIANISPSRPASQSLVARPASVFHAFDLRRMSVCTCGLAYTQTGTPSTTHTESLQAASCRFSVFNAACITAKLFVSLSISAASSTTSTSTSGRHVQHPTSNRQQLQPERSAKAILPPPRRSHVVAALLPTSAGLLDANVCQSAWKIADTSSSARLALLSLFPHPRTLRVRLINSCRFPLSSRPRMQPVEEFI